jgi:hypothetical protein
MPKLDDQISTLQERLKQLKLRQQRTEARKRAVETQRERRNQTRRQFLVGSVVLNRVSTGNIDSELFRSWLNEDLLRAEDRALFELPPKTE